uniref:Outer membrane protein beta-barrel domain-containing protein n=1 Tax=Chryseobacterium endophyticum TaxID=1854762 RepID=A0AAU6WP35_9FLAO
MIKKLIALSVFSISVASFAQKISISPSVGYAWRLAKTSANLSRDQKEYLKGLKSGVNFDVALRYEVKTGLLIGFKYSNYSASTSGRFSVMDNMGNVVSANVSTKDNINFYGPEVTLTNDAHDTKHKLFMSAALGAMTYTSKTENVKGKGTTFWSGTGFCLPVSDQ